MEAALASTTLTAAEAARYSRQVILDELGAAGQAKLKAARVLVVGSGGLGAPVLAYLCAAGVGTLGVVEFDTVDVSNLHRQILFDDADVGRPKLQRVAERLRAQNPFVNLELYAERLTPAQALELVAAYDLVVDTTDNFATRYLVNDACVVHRKPLFSASILRFEGQMSVFHGGHGPCYRCLFPCPPPEGVAPSCADAGVIGVVPGVLGSLQANEVIKWIIGAGRPMLGRLLTVDALTTEFTEYRVVADAACAICHPADGDRIAAFARLNAEAAQSCAFIRQWDAAELQRMDQPFALVDVRNADELALQTIAGALHIPLPELADRVAELPEARELVFVCQSGIRSDKAARLALAHGHARVGSLRGGAGAWLSSLVAAEGETRG